MEHSPHRISDGAEGSPTASPTSQAASFEGAPSPLDSFDLAPDHRGNRYTCPICCERREERLDRTSEREDLDCGHHCCQACLRKAVKLDDKRCPQCRSPLSDLEVFRGTVNDAEWIEAEKDKVWKARGCAGMKCGSPLCVGVVEGAEEGLQLPCRIGCPRQGCAEEYCARCRIPWRDQHRCEDLVRAEREAEQRRQRAEQEAEQRRREEELGRLRAELDGLQRLRPPPFGLRWTGASAVKRGICLVMVMMAAVGVSVRAARFFGDVRVLCLDCLGFTALVVAEIHFWRALRDRRRQLQRRRELQAILLDGHRFQHQTLAELTDIDNSQDIVVRECPRCHAMTWRDQGCNMIYCTQCRTEWCFLCGREGEHGCTHFNCTMAGRTPP
mmetsp:Transcript_58951/g.166245  ORF Transcript_58951/g.166245 Transcript_58951/m.166245 type:complete len:385 (-) Transcript_58951:146-1300(-)